MVKSIQFKCTMVFRLSVFTVLLSIFSVGVLVVGIAMTLCGYYYKLYYLIIIGIVSTLLSCVGLVSIYDLCIIADLGHST
jgi:hypothetical protein